MKNNLGRSFLTTFLLVPLLYLTIHTGDVTLIGHFSTTRTCKSCDIYDVRETSEFDFKCLQMKFVPRTPICIYPVKEDIYISRLIVNTGMWEKKEVMWTQDVLRTNSDMGLIDIGTNIGVFSLTVAAMGHNVLSVEPKLENARRFHKAVKLGHLEDRVTLVTNAVNDKTGNCGLDVNPNNQGNIKIKDIGSNEQLNGTDKKKYTTCITINDLVPLCRFKKAFMKMDIEGNEHKALSAAGQLFHSIDIRYIVMEWHFMRQLLADPSSKDCMLVNRMIAFLEERDYVPMTFDDALLNKSSWNSWPNVITWRKKTTINI